MKVQEVLTAIFLSELAIVVLLLIVGARSSCACNPEDGPQPQPWNAALIHDCKTLGLCICEDENGNGHVVGRFLADDPTHRLIDTHSLVKVNDVDAATWLDNGGQGRFCPIVDKAKGKNGIEDTNALQCPVAGDRLEFRHRTQQVIVDNLWGRGTGSAWESPDAWPRGYPEVPKLNGDEHYYPACS